MESLKAQSTLKAVTEGIPQIKATEFVIEEIKKQPRTSESLIKPLFENSAPQT